MSFLSNAHSTASLERGLDLVRLNSLRISGTHDPEVDELERELKDRHL